MALPDMPSLQAVVDAIMADKDGRITAPITPALVQTFTETELCARAVRAIREELPSTTHPYYDTPVKKIALAHSLLGYITKEAEPGGSLHAKAQERTQAFLSKYGSQDGKGGKQAGANAGR